MIANFLRRPHLRSFLTVLVAGVALAGEKERPFTMPPAEVPVVVGEERVRNPIDAFVLQKLEGAKLDLAPEASRPSLLRKVLRQIIALLAHDLDGSALVDPLVEEAGRISIGEVGDPHAAVRGGVLRD